MKFTPDAVRPPSLRDAPSGAGARQRVPFALDDGGLARGAAAQQALDGTCPGGAADERILHELVGRQLSILLAIHDVEEQLAGRVMALMDNPPLLLAVTKILREASTLGSAMTTRIQRTLSTAASLRAQRRFLSLHQGRQSDV